MQNRLFVHNFKFSVTEQDLREFFGQVGPVEDAQVARDAANKSRGYGFVSMRTEFDALRAIENFNDYKWQGRELHVRIAQDKPPRHMVEAEVSRV